MLQALAGVNPQVVVLFHSHFAFLNVVNLFPLKKKKEKNVAVLQSFDCNQKYTLDIDSKVGIIKTVNFATISDTKGNVLVVEKKC